MNLIIILISIAIDKFSRDIQNLRRFEWFRRYQRQCLAMLPQDWSGTLRLVLLLALPLILLELILAALPGLFDFLLAVAVLVLCLGPRDLTEQVQEYLDACEREDQEAAARHAAELCGTPTAEGPAQISQVIDRILIEINERYLAVIFWFVVLGPFGALLYRLTALARRAPDAAEFDTALLEAARGLHAILAWLPARICALSYALAGSMTDALHNWREYDTEHARYFADRSTGLLIMAGRGALSVDTVYTLDTDTVAQTLELGNRALLIWIILIALLTLFSLAF
ncbi:MAG: regulatory signaling modulator protein AmpE [Pseudomonadota bacterium]